MTTFQICWIIAGTVLGFTIPQYVAVVIKARTPGIYKIAFAFVGALIAYTIVR